MERKELRPLGTHTLLRETWVERYYDILKTRAKELLDHPDKDVRAFAAETTEEIRIFGCSEDSCGYVFYVMERAAQASYACSHDPRRRSAPRLAGWRSKWNQ